MSADRVLNLCIERGWKLAVAESCTGGLIGARLTAVPGSSATFLGGVIAYANAVKSGLLGVPVALIDSLGAVSGPVAESMASGVTSVTGADCGIAVTGIAGPEGGTPDKPIGTVWIAVTLPTGKVSRLFNFPGNREEVREQAVNAALQLFFETVKAD